MDRAQKEQLVDDLGQIFESSGVIVASHYAVLPVAEMQDLRAKAREAGGSVRVAKNRLAKMVLGCGKMVVMAPSRDIGAHYSAGQWTRGALEFEKLRHVTRMGLPRPLPDPRNPAVATSACV